MAKMLPPVILEKGTSPAEYKVFGFIKKGLSDEWTALYSVPLSSHPHKRWAEIDFLLVGPDGIYCLEVKGGRISRSNGEWHFTDRNGNTTSKREGPFEQAGSAAAALRSYLIDSGFRYLEDVPYGYGVVAPDITFSIQGPDIEPDVIYDERDLARPFSEYIRRLTDFTVRRTRAIGVRNVKRLTPDDSRTVIDLLREDFDLRPSLKMQVGQIDRELVRLTHEQDRALKALEENSQVIVKGGAGTGKTLLALEEAKRHAAASKHVLLCCFNTRLAGFLKQAASKLPFVEVWHFHGLLASLIAEAGLTDQLPRAEADDLYTKFYPQYALDALLSLDRLESYDVLIADEAQDLLLETYLDVFDALLKCNLRNGYWRFFLDPNQDLFGGLGVRALQRLNTLRPVSYQLTLNCRNSLPIGMFTAMLTGASSDNTLSPEGPAVDYRFYRDYPHERREVSRLIGRVISEGILPQNIVILSRYRRENSSLKDGFLELPYKLLDVTNEGRVPSPSAVGFSTISGYKGLECDVVIVIDIDDLEHPDALGLVYVGTSRAKAILAVFLHEKLEDLYKEKAQAYGKQLGQRLSNPDN